MRNWFVAPMILLVFLVSCSDKYQAFRSQYRFRSENGSPAYRDLNYWAAHPWKKDPSDSVPAPLKNELRDSIADVFFLHPTTFTRKRWSKKTNARIDDDYLNARTDYSSILYQASAFNQQSRVFAPRYRQAHIKNFFVKDKAKANKAFDLAYEDVKAAFEYYMQHWNGGRPFIIASHSQGSLLAERLLKEYVEDKPLQHQLIAAYIIGWVVPKDYIGTIKMCGDSLQTGCICSWRTLRRGFVPRYLKNEKGNAYATNPLNWSMREEYVPRQENKGSVLRNFNRVYPRTTGAQVSNGLLYVKKPVFPWSFIYFTRNYHIGDINLYYINLRENIRQRIKAFADKK